MSWAEIKKAVNSDLSIPLNEQIEQIKNDYLTIDISNNFIDQTFPPPSGTYIKQGWIFDINAPVIVYLMNIQHTYGGSSDNHFDTLYIDDEAIQMETSAYPTGYGYTLKSVYPVSSITPVLSGSNVLVTYFRLGNSKIVESIAANTNYEQYQTIEDWKASLPFQDAKLHNVLLQEPIVCRSRFALYSQVTGGGYSQVRTNVRLVYRLLE